MRDLVGVNPDDPWFAPRLTVFMTRLRRGITLRDDQGRYSRHVVELFLQFHRVKPVETVCYELGMDSESLRLTLDGLEQHGLLVRNTLDFPDSVVGEELIRNIHRMLPSVAYDIFEDHSSYCRELHRAIESDLGVAVVPQYCVSSVALGDEEPDLSYSRCCVSHAPIGLRHKVMLDLGKPMRLAPDEISLRLFVKNRGVLRALVFGSEPTLDDDAEALLMA